MGLHKKNILICKKDGCMELVTRAEMVYCSRDCSPLGNYGLAEDGIRKSDLTQKDNKVKKKKRKNKIKKKKRER